MPHGEGLRDVRQRRTRLLRRRCDVGQHRPRIHARQLVRITDKQELRSVAEGGEQVMHQRARKHRRLVDDDQIVCQRVPSVKTVPRRAPRAVAEQLVDGHRTDGVDLVADDLRRVANRIGGMWVV